MSLIERHRNFNPRLRVFHVLVVLMTIVLLGGFFYRQIIEHHIHYEREQRQNLRRVLLPGPRGNIFDREGRLLVGNRPRHTAVVYLAELRSGFRMEEVRLVRERRREGIPLRGVSAQARVNVVQRYLDQVNEITGRSDEIDPGNLQRHFHQRLLLPFPLVTDLDEVEVARLLEQIAVDSKIQLTSSSVRHYPYGSAAAHVLGYVSSSEDLPETDLAGDRLMTFRVSGSRGRTGLERSFDEILQGQTGGEIWVVDPSGFKYGQPIERLAPVVGRDLVTSLDIELQRTAERNLGDRRGAVAMVDIVTGEVLALASRPAFDLNDLTPFIPRTVFDRINEEGGWLNRASQGLYPPGSTFKLITAMAALRAGVIDQDVQSYCTGSHRVGTRAFPCHVRHGHGPVDLIDSLRVSCNVFFYEQGIRAGIEAISAEARHWGLDQPTGVELPFEATRMIVPDPDWRRRARGASWFPGDTANVSIGQGDLLVTPLQMAAFTASLARGETRTRLTILRQAPGTLPDHAGFGSRHPGLPDDQMGAILEGMERAVEQGTARFARIPGERVAGKTGTSQVPSPQGTLHLAWFVGFAPVENPGVAVCVLVEGTDVRDNYAGGTTAAPIARELFRQYLENTRRREDHRPDRLAASP